MFEDDLILVGDWRKLETRKNEEEGYINGAEVEVGLTTRGVVTV